MKRKPILMTALALAVLTGAGASLLSAGYRYGHAEPPLVDASLMRPFLRAFEIAPQNADANLPGRELQSLLRLFATDNPAPGTGSPATDHRAWFFRLHRDPQPWQDFEPDGAISHFTGQVDGYLSQSKCLKRVAPDATFLIAAGQLVQVKWQAATAELTSGHLTRLTYNDGGAVLNVYNLDIQGHITSYVFRSQLASPVWKSRSASGDIHQFFGPDGILREEVMNTLDGKPVSTLWRNQGINHMRYFDEKGDFVKEEDIIAPPQAAASHVK
jgi:hypothetical protein